MNFLLHGASGQPSQSPPPAPHHGPTPSTRFRVTLGSGITRPPSATPQDFVVNSHAAPAATPPVRQDGRPVPSPVSAAATTPLSALTTSESDGRPRYGGALVRVSDLQRNGIGDVLASAGLHLHSRARAVTGEAVPSSLNDVPLSQLFTSANAHSREEAAPRRAPRQQVKRSRGSTTSSARPTRARAGTNSRGRPSRSGRGTRGTTTIALQDNGAPFENSWYTKQHKRYFVYNNKTYRGRQAYKVWKQVQQAEEAYRGRRLAGPDTSLDHRRRELPSSASSTAAAAIQQRRLTTTSHTQATLPRAPSLPSAPVNQHTVSTAHTVSFLSSRAHLAAASARAHLDGEEATLTYPLSRAAPARTPMVKRMVSTTPEALAALLGVRPSPGGPVPPTRQTPVTHHEVIEVDEDAEDCGKGGAKHSVPCPPPHHGAVSLPIRVPLTHSFFDLSDDDEPGRSDGHNRHRSPMSPQSQSSISSCASDFTPTQHVNTAETDNTSEDVVTVDGWVYPRALWQEMQSSTPPLLPPCSARSTSNTVPKTSREAQGGLQIVSYGPLSLAGVGMNTLPAAPFAAPQVRSYPVVDRYESADGDDFAGMHGADLEGMFDVAEQHGGLRFQ